MHRRKRQKYWQNKHWLKKQLKRLGLKQPSEVHICIVEYDLYVDKYVFICMCVTHTGTHVYGLLLTNYHFLSRCCAWNCSTENKDAGRLLSGTNEIWTQRHVARTREENWWEVCGASESYENKIVMLCFWNYDEIKIAMLPELVNFLIPRMNFVRILPYAFFQ